MHVPATLADFDKRDARFDQPPCDEQSLSESVLAVGQLPCFGFGVNFEGLEFGRQHQPACSFVEHAVFLDQRGGSGIGEFGVLSGQECQAA